MQCDCIWKVTMWISHWSVVEIALGWKTGVFVFSPSMGSGPVWFLGCLIEPPFEPFSQILGQDLSQKAVFSQCCLLRHGKVGIFPPFILIGWLSHGRLWFLSLILAIGSRHCWRQGEVSVHWCEKAVCFFVRSRGSDSVLFELWRLYVHHVQNGKPEQFQVCHFCLCQSGKVVCKNTI